MSSLIQWRKVLVLAALALLVGAGSAFAQLQTGNLYGTVTDNQGAPLPGVTVSLTGGGAPQVQVTNAEGQFRFLGLSPGGFALKAELEGFSTVDYPNITISVGRNTTIEVTLTPAVEEVITVTSESPLLDERKISTGNTVSQVELEKIPTARDPWVILQQTPGVLVDRVNVGGNESGQQSTYISPGTNDDNSVWAVDGVVITDMGAIGSSPTYYNFDSFEEMQVTTGGTDVSLATGGVTMNMVTKRGTNEWRFSGRYFLTDESYQSDLDFDNSELGQAGLWNASRAVRNANGTISVFGANGVQNSNAQPPFSQGNAIVEILDYGAEGGGPIVKDRVWIWGSYGTQEIDLLTLRGVQGATGPGSHDVTELPAYAAKINAQVSANNSLTAFYHFGDKKKSGRNAGPTRPPATTWNQSGGTPIYKLEDTHIFNSNFYLTGMASKVEGGFMLEPIGGGIGDPTFPNVVQDTGGVWANSFLLYQTDRPAEQYKIDGNYFFNVASTSHELRFGVSYRTITVESFSTWPGQQLVGLAAFSLGFNRTDRNISDQVDYTSLYVQDTMTFGNLVANFGIRYDLQEGTNDPATIPASPIPFRDFDGNVITGAQGSGGNFAGGDPGFEWESITPRLGLTYALGEQRKTLLRASYSRFADQLASGTVSNTNPANYQYHYFYWYDPNGDGAITPDEIGPTAFYVGFDPNNPGLIPLNITDSNLDAPTTDELVLSVEHSLLPEFLIGLSATFRKYSDILENERLVLDGSEPAGSLGRVHTENDYELVRNLIVTLPDGSTQVVPIRRLKPGLTTNGGVFLTNGDREQDYLGVSFTFNKRLANRWLLRGHVTWSDWEWDVPNGANEEGNNLLPGTSIDGGAVLLGAGTTSGSKGNVFINSNWAFDISGLYQIAPDRPWGFNVAANISGREGYPIPYNVRTNPGDAIGTRNFLAVTDVESYRNDDVIIFNARLEKEFHFSDFGLTLSVDGFNLLNNNNTLQTESSVRAGVDNNLDGQTDVRADGSLVLTGLTAGDYVREIVSPRVFRLGARFSFR